MTARTGPGRDSEWLQDILVAIEKIQRRVAAERGAPPPEEAS